MLLGFVGRATGWLGGYICIVYTFAVGVVSFTSAVGLLFGDGGPYIVATTSAHVCFAGVFLVTYSAT